MHKIYNILAYGESFFKHYPNYIIYDRANEFNFGVNDMAKNVECDFILIIDSEEHFTIERINNILYHRAQYYFFHDFYHKNLTERALPITFKKERSVFDWEDLKPNFEDDFNENLPFSYNSPFVAACIAIRLGAPTQLNFWGVDFNTDSAINLPWHEENINDFRKLAEICSEHGITCFTTPESRLSEFMQIHPSINQ